MNSQQKIRIALLDDEELIVDSIKMLLESNGQHEVVLAETNGEGFLQSITDLPQGHEPQIILLDINMSPLDGYQIVDILQQRYDRVKIIILSSHYKSAIFGQMVKLGISAFVPKNTSKEHLFNAIQEVHTKGVYFSLSDQMLLADYIKKKKKERSRTLIQISARETEVLQLICEEHTNQEIANKLYLSKLTVEGHRQNLIDKIGAKNTVGLVVFAIINELYSPGTKYFS